MSEDYTMYILVNNDLNMGKGKIASQVGHVVEKITAKILQSFQDIKKPKQFMEDYINYTKSGNKKIILKGTQEQLQQFITDTDSFHIIDAGKTEIPAGSLTVIGFLPSNKNKNRFSEFKLL